MHAASATEGDPISLNTIFDGLGTLILESSREETVEIVLEKLNKSLNLYWKESPS